MIQTPNGNGDTILVIDDEENIRFICQQALTKLGYKVLTAPDGERGLELYCEEKEQICLVILDLTMPRMGGIECLEEILKANPQAKVIIISGAILGGSTKELIKVKARAFQNKPISIVEMHRTVREVLEGD